MKEKLSAAHPQFNWTIGQKDGAIDVLLTSRAGGRTAEILVPVQDVETIDSAARLDAALRSIAARSIQQWSTLQCR